MTYSELYLLVGRLDAILEAMIGLYHDAHHGELDDAGQLARSANDLHDLRRRWADQLDKAYRDRPVVVTGQGEYTRQWPRK